MKVFISFFVVSVTPKPKVQGILFISPIVNFLFKGHAMNMHVTYSSYKSICEEAHESLQGKHNSYK